MTASKVIGFGAMRLGDDAPEVLAAAIDAGVTLLDTAHAYGEALGDNERLVGRAWRPGVEVVTKVGMKRPEGRWAPDGKRKTILAQAEASCEALGRVPDATLLHAPDPRTPLRTSARALAEVRERGLARAVGLSNVGLAELAVAREVMEVDVVELAIGPHHEDAVRGGVVERCLAEGVRVLAHSPLGGPKKHRGLGRHPALAPIAEALGVSAQTVALAWLYGLGVVPIPGATRVETARLAAAAAALQLDAAHRAALDDAFAVGRLLRTPRSARRVTAPGREVVVLMGIPGAGKSTAASEWTERGYLRLNRDERGGTLAALADALDRELAAGVDRVVMDATYATRAQRSRVLEVAWSRGARARCVWIDTPLAEAQINAVDRMLRVHGRLLDPDELRAAAKAEPNTFAPRVQFRFRDSLEPPADDEGFVAIERVPFERRHDPTHDRAGVVCDVTALDRVDPGEERPVLVLAWLPGAPDEVAALRARLPDQWSLGACVHPAGPPICWCRRPLPGLVVEWLRRERVDPGRSTYHAASPADATLAERLGFPADLGTHLSAN